MATSYYPVYKQAYGLYANVAPPAPAMPRVVVDSQRVATLSQLPAGTVATDYEYELRPITVNAQRVVDASQLLNPGESFSDYEYELV